MIFVEDKPDSGCGGSEISFLDLISRYRGDAYLFYRKPGNLIEKYRDIGCHLVRVPINNYRLFESLRFSTRNPILNNDVYINQYYNIVFGCLHKIMQGGRLYCHLRLPPPTKLGFQLRFALAYVDLFIAVSNFTRQQWVNYINPKKTVVVWNGISVADFVPSSFKYEYPTIFFASRNVSYKGLDSLIKSLEFLPSEYRLLVLGEFSDYISSERIRFLGKLSHREIRFLLPRCSIAVMPSEWPEPFGRVLIEAMACNIPAIGSDVGGIPEVVLDKSHLFPSKSPYALATKIQEKSTSDKNYRVYVEEKFNIDFQARKVFNFIGGMTISR
jgi:glycosyltransferase involved in cell wall biosynthesis